MKYNNNVIKTELIQRAFDNKWVMFGLIKDPNENPTDWFGREDFIPVRWVPLQTYDYLVNFQN